MKTKIYSIEHADYQQAQTMRHDAMTVYGITFGAILFGLVFAVCVILAGKSNKNRYAANDRAYRRNVGRSIDNEVARLEALMK